MPYRILRLHRIPPCRQHALFSSGDDKYAAGAVTSGFVSIHSEMAESAAAFDAGRTDMNRFFSCEFFLSFLPLRPLLPSCRKDLATARDYAGKEYAVSHGENATAQVLQGVFPSEDSLLRPAKATADRFCHHLLDFPSGRLFVFPCIPQGKDAGRL